MRLALVVTTYERPDALAAVLASVARQTRAPDELIVADDGSSAATRRLVEQVGEQGLRPTPRFVQQPHQGFRVTRLRNLAIANTAADYVVFVDGDMLLDARFVADHARAARPGHFVQGVRILLDAPATESVLAAAPQPPAAATLRGSGLRRAYGWHSAVSQFAFAQLGNAFIAIKGCNQSYWREDLIRVNGFNEDIEGWGPEDKELCARLAHVGVKRRTLLGGGIAWHLHHPPAQRSRLAANAAILEHTRANRTVRCARGLDAHAVL
jgi:glycosyltransferase involved in cell wall biosynthesis